MGFRGGIALLAMGTLLIVCPAAGATMQLVSVNEPTPAKTFVELHGLNPSADQDLVSVDLSGNDVVISDQVGIGEFPPNCRRLQTTTVSCPFAAYDDVSMRTGPGNDQVTSSLASPNLTIKQIFGPTVSVYMNAALGGGNDRFVGGDATDAVSGGTGRDVLSGGGGNDLLNGNAGNDLISGGDGGDDLFGNGGRDRLIGGPGVPDYMIAGKGRDTCIGHERRDRVLSCEKIRLR
jgi:Ca2+-binding RTX toxin-like protein